mgnify:CR=1 FL=1
MPSRPQAPSTVRRWIKPMAAVAMIFGVMTVFSGGSVLFGSVASRASAGNYVGFVLWFNFLAGGAYVLAGIGLWLNKSWAVRLSALIAIATAFVAFGFAVVVLRGTPFEMRTVGALALRFTVWAAIAVITKRAQRSA